MSAAEDRLAAQRLFAQRNANAAHANCTAESCRHALIGLRADGYMHCPTCERPIGDPDGPGLAAAVDACEPPGTSHERPVFEEARRVMPRRG